MKNYLLQLGERIDAFSLRERLLLMLTLLAVVVGLWYVLLYQPLVSAAQRDTRHMQEVRQQFAKTSAKVQSLVVRFRKPPNELARTELVRVRAQIKVADHTLRGLTVGLITPGRMAAVLRTLLATNKQLSLVRMVSLPPVPLIKPGKGKKTVPIYTHGLEIQFVGSFGSALAYLQSVQKQHWNLYWDGLELHTQGYPRLSVTLRVHTLGVSQAWLGLRDEGP